jgi:hypothetical protein
MSRRRQQLRVPNGALSRLPVKRHGKRQPAARPREYCGRDAVMLPTNDAVASSVIKALLRLDNRTGCGAEYPGRWNTRLGQAPSVRIWSFGGRTSARVMAHRLRTHALG